MHNTNPLHISTIIQKSHFDEDVEPHESKMSDKFLIIVPQ